MPFKSEKQRKFLFKYHPDIAKRWADEKKTTKRAMKLLKRRGK